MLVETYEVTETNPETGVAEFEPEALALIESLDLDGQRAIMSARTTDSGDEVGSLCPYAEMDKVASRVYRTVLPDTMKLHAYDRGPIPVRVLQVAALAEREKWFDEMEVWCPDSSAEKDPLLVGVRKVTEYERRFFLLARWGEVLLPFEELVKVARERWTNDTRAELEERIADAQTKLAAVDAMASKHFAGGYVHV